MAVLYGNDFLHIDVAILKSRVTKTGYQSVVFAVLIIILASMLTSHVEYGEVTLSTIYAVQQDNYVLWLLDLMPFIFGVWGQHATSVIANEASNLVLSQTRELRDKTEDLERKANYSSTHDELTGLPNLPLFYDRVEQAIFSANLVNQPLCIVNIDIFNYKEVHDTLGRDASDSLIKQISVRFNSAFETDVNATKTSNTIARIDTNTFSLLLMNVATQQKISAVIKSIDTLLEPEFMVADIKLSVHANIGIVTFPKDGEDVNTLIQRAGIAVYMAQNSNSGHALYDASFDMAHNLSYEVTAEGI
jgi:diguanylate cyclase (GGDEF)-like protein